LRRGFGETEEVRFLAVIQVRECGRVERIKNATKNASREVRGRRQEGEENRCKDITAQVVY